MDLDPLEVKFQHAPPEYLKEYQRIFRAPLRFKQLDNALVFKRQFLDLKIPHSNPYIQTILSQHAESLTQQLDNEQQIQLQVQTLLFDCISQGRATVEMVSSQMNISRRTLHRKLKQEGTSFQQLLKKTRKHLAMNYLQQTNFSINEVAFLLGFSDYSAFHRAFKRWFGKNPREYRQLVPSNTIES